MNEDVDIIATTNVETGRDYDQGDFLDIDMNQFDFGDCNFD